MKKALYFFFAAATAIILLSFSVLAVGATVTALPGEASYNLSQNDYDVRAQPVCSYLAQNSDKTLVRVECSTNYKNNTNKIIVETYSSDGSKLKSSTTIRSELPFFGGFFSGEKYNFFVFGQKNPDYNNSTEILRVVRYSKAWKRLSSVSVFGSNTLAPFNAGSLRMTEYQGKLVVHTCHTMYPSSDGLNHQANMTFVIDEENSKLLSSNTGVTNIGWTGYVSHSFNQFVKADGSTVYRVDHGDAYPRAISIVKSSIDSITDVDYTVTVDLSKTGTTGANWTGASVGGFEIAGGNCLIAGNVVNYKNYDTSPDDTRNVFVSVTKKDLSSTSVKMLTSYTSKSGISVLTPHLVKINEKKLLVIWEEKNEKTGLYQTKIASIDASGKLTSSVYSNDYFISDCQPILCADGLVRWYVGTGKELKLYTVNPSDLSACANNRTQTDPSYTEVVNVSMQVGERYHLDVLDAAHSWSASWGGWCYDYDHDNYDIVATETGSGSFSVSLGDGRSSIDIEFRITVYLPTPVITGAEVRNDGIKINWNRVKDAEYYRIFVKSGSSWKSVGTVDGSVTSFLDKSAKVGNIYTYTVRCVNYWDEYTSDYNRTGFAVKYLTTPKITKCENVNGGAKISWTASEGAYRYRVFVKSGSSWKKLADVADTSYTHVISSSGASYTYTVRCITKDGKTYISGYNNTGRTNKYIAAPAGIKCKNVVGGTYISWTASAGAVKYRVFVKSGSSWKALADVTGSSYTHKISESGSSYTYTVRCVSGDGKTYVSGYNGAGVTNKYVAAPAKIKCANVNGGAYIWWKASAGAVKYRVFVKSGSSWKALADVTGTSYTHKISSSGSSYTYTVRCVSGDGKTYVSGYNDTGVRNKYVAPPVLKGVKNSSKGVVVSYTTPNGASGMRIFRKTGSGDWTKIGDVDPGQNTFTDKSAKNGVKYTYTVRCISADKLSYESGYDKTGLSITCKR